MSELRDLYQEVILDHSKHPRNRGRLEGAREARGHNPLCGDQVTIYVQVEAGRIRAVTFEGSGCAISTASTSMLTDTLVGKTPEEAEALFRRFHDVVTGEAPADASMEALGKLAVFAGVAEFPVRVKCATLPWHTLRAALEGADDAVTTE